MPVLHKHDQTQSLFERNQPLWDYYPASRSAGTALSRLQRVLIITAAGVWCVTGG